MKTLTLYLIRHGQTEWNVQGLMQGWGDSPLTAQGIHAARLTGRALCDVPFAAAYSSCLPRTIATAHHILHERAAHVPLFQHTGLNEQHFGDWEGRKVEDIRATAEFQQLVNAPAAYRAETNGGETWAQLAARPQAAINDIVRVHESGNLLIVSHGHTLRLLLALMQGATWQNHREAGRSETLHNTAINIVRYRAENDDDSGHFQVERVNDTAHLA